jgi:hypothetical protein
MWLVKYKSKAIIVHLLTKYVSGDKFKWHKNPEIFSSLLLMNRENMRNDYEVIN